MPSVARNCTVCNLEEDKLREVEFRLIADEFSFDDGAKEYGVSSSALYRHFCEHIWSEAAAFKKWFKTRKDRMRIIGAARDIQISASAGLESGGVAVEDGVPADENTALAAWYRSRSMLERVIVASEAEGDVRAAVQAAKALSTVLDKIVQVEEKMAIRERSEEKRVEIESVQGLLREWRELAVLDAQGLPFPEDATWNRESFDEWVGDLKKGV